MKQPFQKNQMNDNNNYSWDAQTYDKVSSNVRLELGRKLLDKSRWIGNEIVMDSDVGTKPIRIKSGPIVANDASSRFSPSPKINAIGLSKNKRKETLSLSK